MSVRFRVFPLWPIVDGKCGCGRSTCKDIGKHPKIKWRHWEGFEISEDGACGIRTGDGLFIVDLDVKEDRDGVASFHALANGRDIPDTLVIATPSGGFHLYFQAPEGVLVANRVALAPGVDVRGEGGFVVGPGSPHKSGGTYKAFTSEETPIVEAPAWLLELVRKPEKESPKTTHHTIDPDSDEGKRAVAWVREWLETAEPSIEGQDGSGRCLYTAIECMRSALPLETIQSLLEEVYNPRCEPPWSVEEIRHKVIDADLKADFPRGLAPEGVFERLGAPIPSANPPASRPPRDSSHAYKYRPGDRSVVEGVVRMRPDKIVDDLYGHADWDGVLWYDEFKNKIEAVNPPVPLECEEEGKGLTDTDIFAIQAWFASQGRSVGVDAVHQAILLAAKRRTFHPVKEYLFGLPRTTERDRRALYQFASEAFGAHEPISAEMFRKTLVAAVRRILVPGTKVDTMLILKGETSYFKSQALAAIFGERFFKDQLPDLRDDAKASHSLLGFWGIESAELDKFLRADNTTAKAFLSRQEDCYHAPYGRNDVRHKRQCVFLGTTNDEGFLTDPTGNRRYWIIVVTKKIDIDYVKSVRDSLWAAALELAQDTSYEHWFDDAKGEADESREAHIYRDPWHEIIEDYCSGREWTSSEEVYARGVARSIPDALSRATQKEQKRVCAVLKRLGCKTGRILTENGERPWRWLMPQGLLNRVPSRAEIKRREADAAREALENTNDKLKKN